MRNVINNPAVVGILNTTPDSFSDGGLYLDVADAVAQANRMIEEGADLIDIGGESTRPGAPPVPPAEQIRRTIPVITELRRLHPGIRLSIDTRSAAVADTAVGEGASMINDVSALRDDPEMVGVAARRGVDVVLMHMRGTPQNMQQRPQYHDAPQEILDFLQERIRFAIEHGVCSERIVIDPGIGFGKSVEHNLQILGTLQRFARSAAVMLGVSLKSFIARILSLPYPNREIVGTVVANTIGVLAGVRYLRVHDVAAARQTVDFLKAYGAHTTL